MINVSDRCLLTALSDCSCLQPMDELFARDYSLVYTTDPNMASYKGEDKMPVQVRRPSARTASLTLSVSLREASW